MFKTSVPQTVTAVKTRPAPVAASALRTLRQLGAAV